MKNTSTRILYFLILALSVTSVFGQSPAEQSTKHEQPAGRWSVEKAKAWYAKQPWLVGCNFIPSNAINQLEMWQADTFDMKTIERELDLAKDLGFNTVRVYLHDLAYEQDPEGFLDRIDQFLTATSKRGIRPILIFFDDVWLLNPKIGKQPEPLPGVHNSGWLQSPGLPLLKKYPNDPKLQKRLKTYVQSILKRFGQDDRVLMWDLYNEPSGNWSVRDEVKKTLKTGPVGNVCLPLLRDVYAWAREINPKQPLTSCVYHDKVTDIALNWADIVTFHNYQNPRGLEATIKKHMSKIDGRPLICTEYMARTAGSCFETCLPVFAKYNVGAVSWGLVAGKTNTIYTWGTCRRPGKLPEPNVWFCDIYRTDGTPYSQKEVDFIRKITKEKREQ